MVERAVTGNPHERAVPEDERRAVTDALTVTLLALGSSASCWSGPRSRCGTPASSTATASTSSTSTACSGSSASGWAIRRATAGPWTPSI
ncbi:hypothetical protein [Streptomyces malaysiensis]|uniref:hypothetical protein n=1 Tax=Streptomyces malaysiensis TaxID=92644 RepID=UPI003D7C26F0